MPDLVPNLVSDALYFVPLGGTGEIGMNFNAYHTGGKWLAVDLGLTFADELLPGVDLVLPDPGFLAEHRKDLVGLVITHGHEDHLGAVPYLWPALNCPIYATRFAAALLRDKLSDFGLLDRVPLHLIPDDGELQLGPFGVRYVPVTHSIPEAHSLLIETAAGTILHTGDWKLDPEPMIGALTDEAAFRKAGDAGVLAVVGDSTNVMKEGWSGSEATVRARLETLIVGRKGGIAVTLFASNVARLTSVIHAARAAGREVALAGRSLWRYLAAAREAGLLDDDMRVLREEEGAALHPEQVLFICTGCQGETRAAMARIAGNTHPRVSLARGDTVIFSSKIIPGNEKSIGRMHNRLAERGIEIIDERDPDVHVSGHPQRDELRTLYSWVRPNIVVPVHGESRHLISHAELAEEIGVDAAPVISNGDVLKLAPGEPEVVGEVPTGRLAVDGAKLVAPTHASIRARRRLMENGAVFVTVIADANGALLQDPAITGRGILDEDGDETVVAEISAAAASAAGALPKRQRRDDAALQEAVRLTTRRMITKSHGKRPLIDVHLVRV